MARLTDRYGLHLNGDQKAFDYWMQGLDMALAFDESGIEPLRKSIQIDPDFALAHLTLGHQLVVHGFGKQGREHISIAKSLIETVSEREASQIEFVYASANFDDSALNRALGHLERWPTDIFVFSHVVGPFGLLAFSGNRDWRQANVDLLLRYRDSWPVDDWWFLTTLGFMRSDTGDTVSARRDAEKAWELMPNGNCAHALSHVHIEEGALEEARGFIEDWLGGIGKNSDIRHHLCWHGFVIDSLSGNASAEKMDTLYRQELDSKVADPMPLSTFSDNASFLWRGKLRGFEAPPDAVEDTIAYMEHRFPKSGFAFADIHRIMIVALSDSNERKQKLRNELLEAKSRDNDVESASHALLGMMDGFVAFSEGEYTQSAETLSKVVDAAVLLGGSNPQRHVVEETYQTARYRAGIGEAEFSGMGPD